MQLKPTVAFFVFHQQRHAFIFGCVLIVRQLDGPTLLHYIEKNRLVLFESLWTVCISMLPLLIQKKIKEIYNSNANHIFICCLQDCRTIELSDYRVASDRIPFGHKVELLQIKSITECIIYKFLYNCPFSQYMQLSVSCQRVEFLMLH